MRAADGFVQRITQTIEKYEMIQPGDHVIVGVSGGADSVCLLAVLRLYQMALDKDAGGLQRRSFQITVVHVEHGLRGEASLEDARFVQQLCEKWQLPCRIRQVDIRAEAARKGETLEEAGRRLRYDTFREYSDSLGANRIAVAHNQNDQAETVLLNLTRGSGLRGLGGILPVREMTAGHPISIIRPLLYVSRREIEQWMEQQQLPWRTDGTNLETEYTRNKLRLEILPKLETEVNREAVKHMASAAAHLQKAEQYLRKQAEKLYAKCVKTTEGGAVIKLPLFLQEEELLQEYVLRLTVERLLSGRGLKDYSEIHFEDMKRLAAMPCGKRMDFPGGLQGVRQREELCLRNSRQESLGNVSFSDERRLDCSGIYEFSGHTFCVDFLDNTENMQGFPEKKYTKWIAYDTIKHDVCLRTRRTGDYLIVNQNGGRKKLKDYMIDQKIPREERDKVLLLAEDSHILWVVGWRISEAAKVTKQNKKILKIQMMEDRI